MKNPNQNKAGYKESKVGWIPEEWSIGYFRDAFKRVGVAVAVKGDEVYREIGIRSHGRGIFHKPARSGTSLGEKRVYFIEPDCLIFNIVFAWEQAVAVTEPSDAGYIASHRFPMYRAKVNWNPHFVAWHFKTNRGRFDLGIASPGGAGRNRTLGQSELAILPLAHPPIEEQRKIAEILSTCDGAIERTSDLIAAKNGQKKAMMQQLLTGKKRLPGFKDKWAERTIGSLYKTVSRPVSWNDDDVYSLISVRRRSGGVFLRERLKGSEILTKTLFIAHTGDFLISKMQVLHGAMGLVSPELDGCHISGSYIALRPLGKDSVDPAFFTYFSDTPEFRHLTYLSSYGVHIEKMTFNLRWFLNSEILIPQTIKEQRAIAEILATADAEITLLEQKHASLQQQKKGLMQKLLTGQIRVKP